MRSRFLLLAMALLTVTASFANIERQKYSMALADATVTAGKTVQVELSMKNAKAVTSWQTKLALPEGVQFVSVEAAGTRYAAEATVNSSEADGVVTIAWDDEENAMTGTEGVVATITLKVAANVAAGTYPLTLQGCTIISDKEWTRTEDFAATLTVEEATGLKGDVNGDGSVDVADIQAILNNIAEDATPATAPVADVNEDGSIDVADIQAVLNIIAEA